MKREKYTVDYIEVSQWAIEEELVASYGHGSHKSLRVYCDMAGPPYYKVFNNRIEELETFDLSTAVELFNELP